MTVEEIYRKTLAYFNEQIAYARANGEDTQELEELKAKAKAMYRAYVEEVGKEQI